MATDLGALVGLMPFAAGLGITLEEASPDRVVAVMPWAPRLCTAGGILHGGALMTLADSAGALVAFLGMPEGASTATITSTTQMFRSVMGGQVRAIAAPLYRGRSTVTIQTNMYGPDDTVVAQTTQIQVIRPVG
jgi:1,4-dihydroxy-2-naphthoyl-CoA hydrolase